MTQPYENASWMQNSCEGIQNSSRYSTAAESDKFSTWNWGRNFSITHVFLYPSLCENQTLSDEEDEENQQQRKFKCDICDIAFRFQVFLSILNSECHKKDVLEFRFSIFLRFKIIKTRIGSFGSTQTFNCPYQHAWNWRFLCPEKWYWLPAAATTATTTNSNSTSTRS